MTGPIQLFGQSINSVGSLSFEFLLFFQVFCDFVPGTVFTDVSSLSIRERLGDGGFGTVYRATLHTKVGRDWGWRQGLGVD